MKSATATPASDATPAAVWRTYQNASTVPGDETSLVERHLPLVRQAVDRMKINLPAHVDADDLYSAGIIGLMAASRRYDPGKDRTFVAYAGARIRGAILDELRRLDWCPRRSRARTRKLKAAINEVEQRTGRAATEGEVCSVLGISSSEYAKWVDEARPVTFIDLDRPVAGDEGDDACLHEKLADENDVTGRETLEKEELRKLLAQRIAELPDIQKKVLAMYYFEDMRLAEIGAAFGLTESRICQIHAQAIVTLRAWLQRARNR